MGNEGALGTVGAMPGEPMGVDRRRCLSLAIAGCAASIGVPSARAVGAEGRWPDNDVVNRLTDRVRAERRRYRIPGMIVSVADRRGTVATLHDGHDDLDGRHPVHSKQRFQIGSITKSMAALIAFQLAEEGALDLDQPVSRYLAGQPLPRQAITARQLLQHTAAIANGAPLAPRSEGGLWTAYSPGTRFNYSNTGYALIGSILESCSGLSFSELVERRIFGPLGMKNSTAQIESRDRDSYAAGFASATPNYPASSLTALAPGPWVDFTGAAGSVASTADDMGRYLTALLRMAAGERTPLLSKSRATEFLRPAIATPERGQHVAYANGLFVEQTAGSSTIHHTGGMLAYSSALYIDRIAGVGGFASANLSLGGYRPSAIAKYGCEVLAASTKRAALPEIPSLPDPTVVPDAAQYEGEYRAENGQAIRIVSAGDGLALAIGARRIRLEAGPTANLFAVPDRAFAIYPLGFGLVDGAVVYAFHGQQFFVRAGHRFDRKHGGWGELTGAYLCENPWRGTVRIVSRPDGLFRDGHVPLVPIEGQLFREGADAMSPERARFDAFVNRRSTRLSRSGVDYVRVSAAM